MEKGYEAVEILEPEGIKMIEFAGLYRERNLEKIREQIDAIARDKNLQAVIIVGNHTYIHSGNEMFGFTGYGLHTSQGWSDTAAKVFGTSYLVTGIGVQVFHTSPLTCIGVGRPPIADYIDFPWPEDIHHIPVADYNKIEPVIEDQNKGIILEALKMSNIL